VTGTTIDGRPPRSGNTPTRPAGRSELQAQRVRAARLFLLPMMTALFFVAAWPLLRTIYFSFTDTKLNDLAGGEWIGFANYLNWRTLESGRTIFRGTLVDPAWWNAVYNTFRFAIISVSIETVLGLMVALILNEEFKGRGLVRAAILIPWAIPTIVSAKLWAWLFNDQFGMINDMLLSIGLISNKIAWTANTDTAMFAVLIVDIWKTTPFMALLCLAGLQMIPRDMYEAAKIDGIHPVRVFFKVTLPLVKPALMVAVIFRLLDALRIFDLVYVLTPNRPETLSMSVYARQQLVDFQSVGYGSAASTLLFLTVALLTIAWLGYGRHRLEAQHA